MLGSGLCPAPLVVQGPHPLPCLPAGRHQGRGRKSQPSKYISRFLAKGVFFVEYCKGPELKSYFRFFKIGDVKKHG